MSLDQGLIVTSAVCLLAALAPVLLNTVLTRGIWISGVIVLLRWKNMRTPDFLAIVLAICATISTIGLLDEPAAQLGVANYWSVCLLFIAVRCTLETPRDFTLVGAAYLAGCTYAAIQIINKSLSGSADAASSDGRIGVDGVNFNYTAYALATGFVVAVGLLRSGDHRRWFSGVASMTLPVFAYAAVQTGCRGAQVSIIVTLLYLLWARVLPRGAWWGVLVLVPALLVMVPLGIYGDTRLLWIQEYFGRATTNMSGRTYLWPVAREMWANQLFGGVGAGMFSTLNPLHVGAHSLVLSVGTELGLIGLTVYVATVVSAWLTPARQPGQGRIQIGLLAVSSLPIWLSGMWELSPAGWVVIAMWSRLPKQEATRQRNR